MTVISYYGLLLNRNANNGHKSYLHDEVLAGAYYHAISIAADPLYYQNRSLESFFKPLMYNSTKFDR